MSDALAAQGCYQDFREYAEAMRREALRRDFLEVLR